MLTIAKCRDLDYYEREVIDGREEYLSEDGSSPGRWVGRLAERDGLTGAADRDALAKAFAGVHPDGFKLTAHETSVAGFDLTLSPSKSVSLVWALGSDDDARQVEESLYAARAEVERYLEANACFVRRGHAGAVVEPGSGFMGAVFLHRTSRLGDPGSTCTGRSSTSPKVLTVAGPRSTPERCTKSATRPRRSSRRPCAVSSPRGSGSCSTRWTVTASPRSSASAATCAGRSPAAEPRSLPRWNDWASDRVTAPGSPPSPLDGRSPSRSPRPSCAPSGGSAPAIIVSTSPPSRGCHARRNCVSPTTSWPRS